MDRNQKIYGLLLILAIGFVGILLFFEFSAPITEADFVAEVSVYGQEMPKLVIFEKSFLATVSRPYFTGANPTRKIRVVVTAYSSTPWETDDNPYVTASGALVEDGIIANNLLAFGTKVRIPELFGDKVFVVQDRLNWRKGYYQVDIWFPSYWQALNFGVKRTYIEVLEG